MMASQKGTFAGVLLCLVVSMTVALQVSIPQRTYEFARGDNITIPCSFKPKNSINKLVVISWLAEADKPGEPEVSVLTSYSTGELDTSDRYEGRASLEQDLAKGVANLKLSSIGLQDNRLFECRVAIPKDDEGQLADTTRLVVLVAPSVPVCKIDGKAEYFQNINLTCQSEEGSPLPTYKWQGYDVRNMPRAPAPRTTDKDGVLSLFNLTMESSGYYVCTSTNKIRSAKCNLTLSVMPPSMALGSTAGIIGGVVVGVLVLLIILIYCCCCRKKKGKAEEYAMGVPEGEEFHDDKPVVNGEVRQTRSKEGDDEDHPPKIVDRRDQYKERSEKDYDDRRSDYDDRRSDYGDRPPKIVDRRDQYKERSEKDYDDRRSDYDDRRSDYGDRRSDYDDRRERHDDRRDQDDRYSDRRDQYDRDRVYDERSDGGRYSDRYDEPYDDRDRPPSVPANKPAKPLLL
ncbi:cell surface A33 antigen [Oncorhynchus tshawytscha]|uniref:Ig-like domain-containing protein n=1 Tax=Oncorhynchus tshawytscha TaxID=74940 RepID=A0A8C8BY89_ONCTS|nr:cell surface A33 antigen [Oncorhynchus tshawytscha]